MIVILASGNGSNFEKIVEAGFKDLILICDNKDAYVIQRAINNNIKYHIIDFNSFENSREYNKRLLEILDSINIKQIVLAGYLRKIPTTIINKYPKIINIHPSLLPSFKGLAAIKQAYDFNVKVTGITIHYIDHNIDEGKIIFQKSIDILEEDTLDSLSNKIHQLEHEYYPKVLKQILKEEFDESIN